MMPDRITRGGTRKALSRPLLRAFAHVSRHCDAPGVSYALNGSQGLRFGIGGATCFQLASIGGTASS